MAQALAEIGYQIAIFSGRSHATDERTRWWLTKHNVPWSILKMRPTNNKYKWMPDEKLKLTYSKLNNWQKTLALQEDVAKLNFQMSKMVKEMAILKEK